VLLALFLSASYSNAFVSLSSVAGNHVRVNHLIRLQQSMSNSTNEPSREPISEPTKRMDLDAVLPNNLSSKKTRVDFVDRDLKFDETCSAFRMVACEHQCLNGKYNAFRMIAYLDFNRFPQNSIEADSDFRDLQCQLFNNIISDSVFSDFQRQLFINIKANTFASLVRAPETSTNQFNRDKSSSTFKLVVASVSNNNALSFYDKSSSTFKLVVVSITNEFSKGPTNDSPVKQRPVSNDDPAIERYLQLHIPMTLTFERSIEAFPIFQLIDVSVPDENDSCRVFQVVEHGHNTFIESTSFNDSSFQLVVKSDFDVLRSEGARASSTKFNYSEISF
jgi:hypothetical protein